MGKVKLQDIAKQVGCSVATVSYVLNNDPKQKIKPETRKKILQMASFMGYEKNSIASALASGKYNLIGIYVGKSNFALAESEHLKVLDKLVEALASSGYQTVLLPNVLTKEVHNLDAVICYDISEDDFKTACVNNYITMLGFDTKVHEPWIFEVTSSFANIKERFLIDDYLLLTYDISSNLIKEEIKKNNKNVLFVSSFSQLDNLKNIYKDKNIVVVGDEMYKYLNNKNLKLFSYSIDLNKKITKLVTCLKKAIKRDEEKVHKFIID